MTTEVYTIAPPRRIPFFIFDYFSYIPYRPDCNSAAKHDVVPHKPSIHDALWEQGGVMSVVRKSVQGVMGRVD